MESATSGEKNEKVWALVLAYVTNRAIMSALMTLLALPTGKMSSPPVHMEA